MKNSKLNNTQKKLKRGIKMKKVYKVAQKLNTTSEEIIQFINNSEIKYELKNGIYSVDENEVKIKLNSISETKKTTQIIDKNHYVKLDKEMKFVIRETLYEFKLSGLDQSVKNVTLFKKVLKDGCIYDFDTLNYVIDYYSVFLFAGYEENPIEFIRWFNVTTPSEFYKLRNEYFKSPKNRMLSLYFEHFYMFNVLTNGENGNIKVFNESTTELNKMKEHFFGMEEV
jgi:hypothetical protein